MARYYYDGNALELSVEIRTLDGCCGIGVVSRMDVRKDACTSKAQRNKEYRKAWEQIRKECLYEESSYYGMFMLTDVTPDSDGAQGAFWDNNYKRDEDVNLHDFARANRFRLARCTFNPNTGNDICLFTKESGRRDDER